MRDRVTGVTKGFGYVQYRSEASVAAAIDAANRPEGLSQPPEPVRCCPGVSGVTSSTSMLRPLSAEGAAAGGGGRPLPPSVEPRPNIAVPNCSMSRPIAADQ